jgi:Mg2+ and Co2+ transporter CorA
MAADGHVVLVLHRVPQKSHSERDGVIFWRDAEGEWSSTDGGPGLVRLTKMLDAYQEVVARLAQAHDEAQGADAWFAVLEEVGPIHRAARNFYEVLQRARKEIPAAEQRVELQAACDLASDLSRESELLQEDSKNALEFLIAKQNEIQSRLERETARAGHRLNILAAVFLPLATVTGIFGMNLHSGLDESSLTSFWVVLCGGVLVGLVLAISFGNVARSNGEKARGGQTKY